MAQGISTAGTSILSASDQADARMSAVERRGRLAKMAMAHAGFGVDRVRDFEADTVLQGLDTIRARLMDVSRLKDVDGPAAEAIEEIHRRAMAAARVAAALEVADREVAYLRGHLEGRGLVFPAYVDRDVIYRAVSRFMDLTRPAHRVDGLPGDRKAAPVDDRPSLAAPVTAATTGDPLHKPSRRRDPKTEEKES